MGYPVTTYSDPNVQTRRLGSTPAEKRFTYGKWRSMSQITDEQGRVTKCELNSLGLRTEENILKSAGASPTQKTKYEYDGSFTSFVSKTTVVRLADSAPGEANPDLVTTYTPDWAGRVQQQIQDPDTLALTTVFEYDANGSRLLMTDPNGYSTTFNYDAQNRLIQINYPTGYNKAFTYDPFSNKIMVRDEDSHITTFGYDIRNRLIVQVVYGATAGDLETLYGYNGVSSIISTTVNTRRIRAWRKIRQTGRLG